MNTVIYHESTPSSTDRQRPIAIITLGTALSVFLALSFVLCVAGFLLFPSLPIAHQALSIFLPGFTLLSWSSFVMGLIESVLWGWYIALAFGSIYNAIARRQRETAVMRP
jgi:hypothetical protein